MKNDALPSPLLSPEYSLDDHSRQVILRLHQREIEKAKTLPTDDPLDPKRLKRVELTWEEMWSQPAVIRSTLEQERQAIMEAARYFASTPINKIILTGCGDSLAGAIGVRFVFEQLLRFQVEPVQAMDLAYYYNHFLNGQTLVIALSSSGATTRAVEAIIMARMRGAMTLALSNTEGSPIMEEADRSILVHAERKGWPTQSSTAAMATMVQFAIDLAAARGVNNETVERYQRDLDRVTYVMEDALSISNESIRQIAHNERLKKMYVFTGAGPCYASAVFGAAKVKECTPDWALAIHMEEFHHYNSLKLGEPLLIIAPNGLSVSRAVDTAREGKRWGGQIYSIVGEGNSILNELSDGLIMLPPVSEELSAFVFTMPVQLFGYHLAMEKFRQAESDSKR
ncbi:MAG: SIS domain-containing protein [Candidatus Methanomethylicaceae archaeon]